MPPDAAESLAAVKQLLPWWIPWGRDALLLIAAAVLTAIGAGAGIWFAFRPLRKRAPEHWAQRARLAHPGRDVARFCLFYFPFIFLMGGLLGNSVFSVLGSATRALLASTIALFVAVLFWRRAENRLLTIPISRIEALQCVVTNLVVFLPHFLVALLAMLVIPDKANIEAALVLIGAALVCWLLSNGREIHVALVLGLVRHADGRLQAIVDRASQSAGVPACATYEIKWPVIKAWGFRMSRGVAFSESAKTQLNDLELEAVCRYILGQLSESRPARIARQVTIITICLCLTAARPAIGSFGYPGLLGIAVCYLVIVRLIVSLIRHSTDRAETINKSTERTAGKLALVLERIASLNLTPAVMPGKRPIEPHLYDRLLAAGIEPDFPRPEPPSLRRVRVTLSFIVILIIAPIAIATAPYYFGGAPATEFSHHVGLLSPLSSHWHIASLGYLRSQSRDWSAAATFFQAAAHLDRDSWHDSANLALVLIRLDRCAEAKIAFEEAEQRFARANSHRKRSDPAHPDDDQFLQEVSDAVNRCDFRPPRGRERRPGRRFREPPEVVQDQLLQPVGSGPGIEMRRDGMAMAVVSIFSVPDIPD